MTYCEKKCPHCGEMNYGVFSIDVCSSCGKIIDKEEFEKNH